MMDKKEIAAVWQAFLDVQEGKYKKEGKKLDPVGKEDGDIDNDGDEDSSDEYLAKRRKAVGKAMGKDKEQKEGKIPPQFLKGKDKKDDDEKEDDSDEKSDDKEEKGKKPEKGVNPFAKKKADDDKEQKEGKIPPQFMKNVKKKKGEEDKEDDSEEKDVKEEKEECPKCKGEGCDHCDGTGYHKMKKENPAIVTLSQKKMKKESLFSDDELAALEEKMKQPNDTGTPSEPFMSTSSGNDKKIMASHKAGSDKKLEDYEEMGEMDGANAGKAVKSQSPTRRGDNRKGDTAMKTVSKASGQ
jgi:hypothetical protein